MIWAYPAESTVVAGGTLQLHVHCSAPSFAVRFLLSGATGRELGRATYRTSTLPAPIGRCDRPWGWPAYAFDVPPDWPAGAYVAAFATDEDDRQPALDARFARALFVVRGASPPPLLVNLPLFTYHAYDVGTQTDGDCLYTGPTCVTLQRPGGGTGGHLWDERHVDVYDPSSPRQTFAHWDAPGIAWLLRRGYPTGVCTDLDLHRAEVDPAVRALLFFGHQEYWTRALRAHLERFVERGGLAAFLCGNTAWFRVRWDDARVGIVRDGKWSDDEPEDRFVGTSYRFGAGRWHGERPPTGYTVVDETHWLLAGTGLRRGETFGAERRLIGYECDGTAPNTAPPPVARADLQAWPRDESGEVNGPAATLVCRRQGRGTIVTAGTVDWVRLLAAGEATVERITGNALERFVR